MRKAILIKTIIIFNFFTCRNNDDNNNDLDKVQTKKIDNRSAKKNEETKITNRTKKADIDPIETIKDKDKSDIKKEETLNKNKKQNTPTIAASKQKNQINIKDKSVFAGIIPKLLLNQKSIKKEQIIHVDITSNGPEYKKIEPGLSFICKCKNPECKTNKDFVFINIGLKLKHFDIYFHFLYDGLFCPVCNYKMEEEDVLALGFLNCYYKSFNFLHIDPNKIFPDLYKRSNIKKVNFKEQITKSNKLSIIALEAFAHCCRYVTTREIDKK